MGVFDWNTASNFKVYAGILYVTLIGFNANNLTRNNSSVLIMNRNNFIPSILPQTQNKFQITQKLVEDCITRLTEIRLLKKKQKIY